MGLNGSSKLAMILNSCSTGFGVEVFLVCKIIPELVQPQI